MSESTGRGPAAREPAADVSEEYLAAGRQAVRTKSTAFDGEIADLIRAAREDLALGGVLLERARDEEDPLIKRAVMNYIKAEFGLDNEDAEKFRAVYERLKVSLAMSSDYVGGGGVAVYWRDEAALIREGKRVKPNGYKETVKTRREVFANKKTATRSEFYTAKQAGDKIALVLEVRGADYQEETLVEYEGRLYEVVRAYTESGETYELNCKEAQEPPETAQEGPDEEGGGVSINETLRAVLEPIAPAEADAYEGKKAVYITFNYHTTPINYGDDEPEQERVSVQVHLYAPLGYDITAKRRAVKKALASAGFTYPAYTNASDKDGQHHVFECETVEGLEEE